LETTAELIKFAKETNIPVILIGHNTKRQHMAQKNFEHMVDNRLLLKAIEITYRILRSLKNRFGSTAEIIYEMLEAFYVKFPILSEILISHKDEECQFYTPHLL
jgi:DNA repair protein RadA/Sms